MSGIFEKYYGVITSHISRNYCDFYYAMNKGILLSTGNVIGVLISHIIFGNTVIKNCKRFYSSIAISLSSGLIYVSGNSLGKPISACTSSVCSKRTIIFGIKLLQPKFVRM